MRVLSAGSVVLLLSLAVAAQSTKPAAKETAANKPAGNLIQVMRGVLFNNANLIFDVQQVDPGAPTKPTKNEEGATQTRNFANVYSGWQVIENAAVALDESVDTILKSGRSCANGTPVPVTQPDYVKTALGLRQTSQRICLLDACAMESGFVNHSAVTVPNQFVQGVFQGPPLRRADLEPARRRRGLACAYC